MVVTSIRWAQCIPNCVLHAWYYGFDELNCNSTFSLSLLIFPYFLSAVERLTFGEFFNHPFLSQRQSNELLSPLRNAGKGPQEDNLPFSLDDVSNGPDRSPSFVRKPSMKSTVGFSSGGFV
ncbi:hypothetical protein RHMOL_Rhmol05G0227000 [Rhododendron molle]|uniref:Uncharacterized protein n=1 Tax=Rhododendron molle TaxID=49168 RepID=A0ACC0NT70_RHOML|nr:hypothetical protein RHMOL_Rhmol05G0227000 [Rhododendron molle]